MVRWPVLRRPPEWGIEPVPPRVRTMRGVDFFVLWFSLGVGLLVLAAGSLLVLLLDLSLLEAILVSVLGSILGSLLLAAAALPGTTHGVPTMASLRPVLGVRGSYGPTALNVFQLLGWAAFELLIMGLAGATLTGNVLGPYTSLVLIPVFGIVVGLLAAGGPIAVVRKWLERFAIWFVLGSTAWIAVQLVWLPMDWTGEFAFISDAPSLLLGLDLVVVMPISWWPLVSDYNRFARQRREATAGTIAGYAAANTVFYVLGAALTVVALAGGLNDFVAAIAMLNLGGLTLLFILVDETDNAFANVYSTAVSLQNAVPKAKQLPLIAGATVLAAVIAAVLQTQYPSPAQALGSGYESFLFAIGGLFVPLLGIVAADHFVVRRGAYRPEEFSARGLAVRPASFIAWLPSSLLYFAIVQGWIPLFPPIGATLPTFLVASAIYLAAVWVEARVRAPTVAA